MKTLRTIALFLVLEARITLWSGLANICDRLYGRAWRASVWAAEGFGRAVEGAQ